MVLLSDKTNLCVIYIQINLACCQASQAVMIGDRLDNDIFPAKSIGMHTVWIKSGLSVYQNDELAYGYADLIIDTLEKLKVIF